MRTESVMRTHFETYLIEKISDQIDGFEGDLEHFGELFGFTDVQLEELAYDNDLTFDHIGWWYVVIHDSGALSKVRYRTHHEAYNLWDDQRKAYEDYLEEVAVDE